MNKFQRTGRNKTSIILSLLVIIGSFAFAIRNVHCAYAQEAKELGKCVCESKDGEASRVCLDKLKQSYFQDNKYSEFVDLLRKLCPGSKSIAPLNSYYIALSRYQQLKYLEEAKNWDEYFSKVNDYRDDIINETAKVFSTAAKDGAVRVYSRLLLYSFHKDQQDNFTDEALSNLVNSALDYAKFNKDMAPIKEAADKLLSYSEKAKAKELYKIYTKELVNSDIKDEALKEIADGFYKNANLELAENIYDIYLEKISKKIPKGKFISELKSIALAFAYKDLGPKDMSYAESIFKRIESDGGAEAFDADLIYLRGFNLEKSKEYRHAKEVYLSLLHKYPDSNYADELTYKTGIIFTYILRDIKAGREYFDNLADKKSTIPYSLASLYQLGLLKQWEGDLATAKGYYKKLIEKSEGGPTDTLLMAQERLKEIEEGAAMEHNLKTFMDVSLKEVSPSLDMSKINLGSNIYYPKSGENVSIDTSAYPASSGCFNVELQYLWSGNLGDAKPNSKQSKFNTLYGNQGTKMINLVLVSSSGVMDYAFDLIDVR